MSDEEIDVVPDHFVADDFQHGEYGPGDSFDDPLPGTIPGAEHCWAAAEWTDEALFFDTFNDDDERDDEPMLDLLAELGVDLDTLDEPETMTVHGLGNGLGTTEDSDEEEIAA